MGLGLAKFATVEEYLELQRYIDGLAASSPSLWGDTVRWYVEEDLFYLLNFVLTKGSETNSQTGERLFLHPFYLEACRTTEWQIANGGGVDKSGRRKGKSTYRTYAATIQRLAKHPNSSGAIVSYERRAARRHARPIVTELETNLVLRTVCDDVFWWDPRQAARDGQTVWSMEEGWSVRRAITRNTQSLEINAFLHGTPTGGGYDQIDFDDIEDYDAVGTPEKLQDLHHHFDAWIHLATPTVFKRPVLMMTNNEYHDSGIVARRCREALRMEPADDPRRVFESPGEDLQTPGGGPLGGTAVYPYTEGLLWEKWEATEDKTVYAAQIACSHRAADSRQLDPKWFGFYEQPPYTWATGKFGYILIDPSRGVKDPTWIWGVVAGWDKTISIVEASMKWLDPALPEFDEEVWRVTAIMLGVCRRVVQIRVEDVGSGPLYATQITKFLRLMNCHIQVVSCRTINSYAGKFSFSGTNAGKRDKEFERLAGPMKRGEILLPRPKYYCAALQMEGGHGLVRTDNRGKTRDLVQYFLDQEVAKFPKPFSDHALDSLALGFEPETTVGMDGKQIGPLLYPPAPSMRDENKPRRRKRSATWMSA
jgi:hypothetical protein